MTVRALLGGHQFDRPVLAALSPDGDPRVVQDHDEDGRYFLEAAALDPMFTDPGQMHDDATAILTHLTGAARLEDDRFRPVRVVGRYDRPRPSGTTDTVIGITDAVQVRDRVTVAVVGIAELGMQTGVVGVMINGVPVQPESRGPGYLIRVSTHPAVAELLALLGSVEQPGWGELYNAFEIIRDAVSGGRKGIQTLMTTHKVPEPEIKRFTGSANHPAVSGPDAHRARQSGSRPARAMTLYDGRLFHPRPRSPVARLDPLTHKRHARGATLDVRCRIE